MPLVLLPGEPPASSLTPVADVTLVLLTPGTPTAPSAVPAWLGGVQIAALWTPSDDSPELLPPPIQKIYKKFIFILILITSITWIIR